MALTNCPSCNKKISDKAKTCSHCGFAVGDASAEDLLRKKSLNKFKQQHSIQNQSMLAMLMFVSGFGFMYWGGAQPGDLQHTLAIACSVLGFVWYVVNRIRLIFIKRAD
ncbi:MAG: zinc ribbon domain-containing protein [Aliiglaciecola sp.]|uniref:zinc-ribbon domain-containing protein n=1 Tax=Aliiglaciecola sp. M165 TaxID=2593649 RepID=UPI001180B32B|nr:zinc-ribbon domain-containing protein [Aliiglaciecola sp. M165]TRY32424.1 zinc ribbon domain-containing protein [Aliiglaciecola sp. M165]